MEPRSLKPAGWVQGYAPGVPCRRPSSIQERRLPPILRLLERRQEDLQLQGALAAEREEGHSTIGVLALRWEELRAQEAELKGHLLRFQPHIAEKEVKCLQAVKKAKGAQDLCKLKEQQLRLLQEEQQSLLKRKKKIQTQIQQYRKFYDYLESIVEASEEFQCSDDVLSRFHTLFATSQYLQQVVQDTQASIDQTKGQLSSFLEDNSDKMQQLDNQLGQLQADLEQAQNQRLLWEARWGHIQNLVTKKTLLLGTIKMAVLNLFQCIAMPSGIIAMDDTVRQLELVRMGLTGASHRLQFCIIQGIKMWS
ncbi:coiled-coil domain-containing protein 42-like [Eleutherodactylus coqui]|uniref:coiled-coil domain-containing protein 42-like n=1 Tax=Eleutherodactylus coqui TaxID=57060 RepID=UPI0034629823